MQECLGQGRGQNVSFGWASRIYVENMGINIKMSPVVVTLEMEPWINTTLQRDLHPLELKKAERGKEDLITAFAVHFWRTLSPIHTPKYRWVKRPRTSDNWSFLINSRQGSCCNKAYCKLSRSLHWSSTPGSPMGGGK